MATTTQELIENAKKSPQPDICKIVFKVGCTVKTWPYQSDDNIINDDESNQSQLICEEIDCGDDQTRIIVSSFRSTTSSRNVIVGERIMVVSNLQSGDYIGFESHGTVLCGTDSSSGEVEFITPPEDAAIGSVVKFGLIARAGLYYQLGCGTTTMTK
jgi:tRNA-binding EMAP/Myf-like protein